MDGEEIQEKLFNLKKFPKREDLEPVLYHFRDGKRKVQFVIVLQDTAIYRKESLRKLLDFLRYLEYQGLEFEFEIGIMDSSLVFLKIHASDNVIKHFANLYDVDIYNSGHNFIPESNTFRCRFRTTDLTRDDDDVFKRTTSGAATSAEKILLLYKIMSDPLPSDESEVVFGVEKLIRHNVVKDVFPMHDGPWKWMEEKQINLNDRQVLAKYWASYNVWYKEQPINLVAKYFGTDVAFYFAWCEYYNFMLIIVAIVGIVFVFANVLVLVTSEPVVTSAFCSATNKTLICPLCAEKMCKFVPVSNYCRTSVAEYVLGNHINIAYAIFISIWVTALIEGWRRRESTLRVRWNVQHTDVEYKIRYDYKDKSTYRKKSRITGKIEPYVPFSIRILRSGFVYFIVLLLVVFVSSYVILLVILKNWLIIFMGTEKEPTPTLWTSVLFSVFQVIFIKILTMFYVRLSVWLTHIQVNKTQKSYDDSIIYKIYLFGFINNYIPILYTAFVRGKFFELPGRKSVTKIFDEDFCLPTGCTILLTIQLFVVMSLKNIGGNIFSCIKRFFQNMLLTASQTKTTSATATHIPTWEREYFLKKNDKALSASQFSEMIIQFGYVSFFMSAFPLVGVIAVLNNFLEFRMNAIRLLRETRRPVPNMVKGIGAWDDIIQFASYFSIVCNAFIVAFNTSFIRSIIYRTIHKKEYLSGQNKALITFIFSRYAIRDLPLHFQNIINATECVYPGHKYPPEHPRKYQHTENYYLMMIWKIVFVIVFENVIFMIIGGIYYFVDEMPRRVKEQLHRERLYTREIKMRMLERKMRNSRLLRTSIIPADKTD